MTNAVFPPEVMRESRDQYMSVIEKDRWWTQKLYKHHPVLITMMNQLRDWARESGTSVAPMANASSTSTPQRAVGSVNLLSVGECNTQAIQEFNFLRPV